MLLVDPNTKARASRTEQLTSSGIGTCARAERVSFSARGAHWDRLVHDPFVTLAYNARICVTTRSTRVPFPSSGPSTAMRSTCFTHLVRVALRIYGSQQVPTEFLSRKSCSQTELGVLLAQVCGLMMFTHPTHPLLGRQRHPQTRSRAPTSRDRGCGTTTPGSRLCFSCLTGRIPGGPRKPACRAQPRDRRR